MGPSLEFSESGTATGGVHKIPIKETVVAASSSDSSLSEGEWWNQGGGFSYPHPKSIEETSIW